MGRCRRRKSCRRAKGSVVIAQEANDELVIPRRHKSRNSFVVSTGVFFWT